MKSLETDSKKAKKPVVVATCGGFDPLHAGHVRLFKEAKKLGDKLVIILNGDDWLKRKKGFIFMNEEERKEILLALEPVDDVVIHDAGVVHVAGALLDLKPDILAKGGDRNQSEVPIPPEEVAACEEIGCEIVYNVGGSKIQSSSWLIGKAKEADNR